MAPFDDDQIVQRYKFLKLYQWRMNDSKEYLDSMWLGCVLFPPAFLLVPLCYPVLKTRSVFMQWRNDLLEKERKNIYPLYWYYRYYKEPESVDYILASPRTSGLWSELTDFGTWEWDWAWEQEPKRVLELAHKKLGRDYVIQMWNKIEKPVQNVQELMDIIK